MAARIPGLFITGTDTNVGKTYVTALIAQSLCQCGCRVGVYKPAASGCRRESGELVSDDAIMLWDAAGRPGDLEHVCPQRFHTPIAPHLAARSEGRELDADLVFRGLKYWQDCSEVILVEGAGGLMSPLGDRLYVADVAEQSGFPLVVVSPNVLGTINQTLLTLKAAACWKQRLGVAGIVLNELGHSASEDVSIATNRQELAIHSDKPVLTGVVWKGGFDTDVSWLSLAH